MPVFGAEGAEASVDELSHLINLEDVLLSYLLSNFIIFLAFLKEAFLTSF